MDNFWCHDVPQDMHEAFNVQKNKNDLNSQSLVRFSAPRVPNFQSHLSNHYWQTINDLSTAANTITPFKNHKRKSLITDDDYNEEQRPTKHYASEEKIMAKFNNLKLAGSDEENDCDEFFLNLEYEDCNNNLNKLQSIEEDLEIVEEDVMEENKNENESEKNNLKYVLCDEAKDFLECDDIITKLYKDEKIKKSKALVLYKPPINIFLQNDLKTNKSKILDKTNDYIVENDYDEDEIPVDDENHNLNSSVQIVEIESKLNNFNNEDLMEI